MPRRHDTTCQLRCIRIIEPGLALHAGICHGILLKQHAACHASYALPKLVRAVQEIPGIPEDHYFVENTTTARAILEAAVSVEVRAHRFYERIITTCEDAELCELYSMLLDFEANHVAVNPPAKMNVSGHADLISLIRRTASTRL